MRPFLNPLSLGGKRKTRAQDVFAVVPFSPQNGGNGRVIALPFVPRLSMQYSRTNSSGLVRGMLDSARPGFHIQADNTGAQVANGAVMDTTTKGFLQLNSGSGSFVAYNYAEVEKFHKTVVVTKASGVALNVDLSSLGVIGEIRAKIIDTTGNWYVFSRGLQQRAPGQGLILNSAGVATTASITVSGTTATLIASLSAGTYVLHCFAHDPSADGLIQCGFYTGNGSSTGTEVVLGWRPQFVEIKGFNSSASSWYLFDTARGIASPGGDASIVEDTVGIAENLVEYIDLTETGFKLKANDTNVNASGKDYMYRAIREAA